MDESGERPHDGVLGARFEQDAEMALEMASLAGRYVDRGRAVGVTLDFSDASIEAADGLGLRLYDPLPKKASGPKLEELRNAVASELGAYFGETFIRNHGGQWGWVAGSGARVFGLRTDAEISSFPLVKARRRLQRAENESLAALYSFLCQWPATQKKRRWIGARFWGRTPREEATEGPVEEAAKTPAEGPGVAPSQEPGPDSGRLISESVARAAAVEMVQVSPRTGSYAETVPTSAVSIRPIRPAR
jgi:hypothetical protein